MSGAERRGSPGPSAVLRFVLALFCLVTAALLLWPGPSRSREEQTWEALLRPLTEGHPIALGYVLGPPQRGKEHDIVVGARSAETGAVIEVHVLDRGRWSGVRETASFAVAYETPRSSAQVADCEAVTEALARVIRANDPGGLGPVDALLFRSEPDPPRVARILDRLSGPRGVAVGLCLAAFTWILATMPGGAWAVAVWLALLGLLLRAPSAGLPFAIDQDVQRLFTGHLPVREILFGQGLQDRHPPLYFLVLHVAQLAGQSEAVGRAPAILFGSLVGPALVWGALVHGRRVAAAALAGLALTVSVELIARSREVSSIPLFALLALVMAVSLAKHAERPSAGWGVAVAASHALALWTYYLAPFLIAGAVASLLAFRRLPRATARVLGIGLAAGAPALLLGVVTFFRDRPARTTAAAHPGLAWGERGLTEVAGAMATLTVSSLGLGVLLALVWGLGAGVKGRDRTVLAASGALLAAFVGIGALAPVARVQPYYFVAVLPLAALCVGIGADSPLRWRRWALSGLLALSVATLSVPRLASARALYLPEADAFMPGFAEIIARSPERQVVTVVHYDSTLLAYYLARGRGVPMDWAAMHPGGEQDSFPLRGVDKVLIPLAWSHRLSGDPDEAALLRLEALLREGPALAVEREAFLLPRLSDRLQRCGRLAESGTGRLYRCPASR